MLPTARLCLPLPYLYLNTIPLSCVQFGDGFGCNFVEPCPKCSHPRAYFRQHQIRSADEPMTIFFKCCNPECGHNWREWLECLLIICSTVRQFTIFLTERTIWQLVSFTCKQLLYILHCVDMQLLPSCTICKASNIVSFLTFTKLALKVYYWCTFLCCFW